MFPTFRCVIKFDVTFGVKLSSDAQCLHFPLHFWKRSGISKWLNTGDPFTLDISVELAGKA